MVRIPMCGDCEGTKFIVEDIPTDKNDPPGQSWTCLECGATFTFFPDGISCPPVDPIWILILFMATAIILLFL